MLAEFAGKGERISKDRKRDGVKGRWGDEEPLEMRNAEF